MTMTNQFDSKGGEQNIAQGDHAIGKQVNVTQTVIGDGNIFSATGNLTVNQGVPPEVFAQYVKELGATEQLVKSFLSTLLEREVPRDQWDTKLQEIAITHKKMLQGLNEPRQATDMRWVQSRQAVEAGNYAKALSLYEQSLRISQEIGDRTGEGAALNNIGQIYYMQGNYVSALRYLEQSLAIHYMLGDKASEAATLNNIAQLHLCTGN
jgi:tetratricopeptide (TPR) repeat protein